MFFTSINARRDMFDVGLSYTFTGPGTVSFGLTEKKCTGEVSLYIKIELNKFEFLSLLIDKNLKD